MQSFFNLKQDLPFSEELTKLSYQTLQQSKSYFSLTHKTVSSQLSKLFAPSRNSNIKPLSSDILLKLQQLINQMLEVDWEDAQKGIYPHSLLFDHAWADFLLYYPALWLDMPKVWQRIEAKQKQDFSPNIDTEGYPSYYLQNFHYQTDGYLGEESANLYDLQVDILFSGLADSMRRRVLAPLKEGLTAFPEIPPQQMRILDVACGTGRTLKAIRAAFPKASLQGTDLSPAYLRKANQILSEIPGELPQLLQANAENLPYSDNSFHGVTSVFLFHELPPQVRQNVIQECYRVLQPGGTFIICDSMQVSDFPEFQPMMENFPAMFHEPYYRSYIEDDLVERLDKAGFDNISTQNHLFSKYWIAHKS